MILLTGADVVLPERILESGTVVVDGDLIVDVVPGRRAGSPSDTSIDLASHYVVPGFIDAHVHGVEGHDTLDGVDAVAEIARRLPRFGVTGFCPTSVACRPEALRTMLAAVRVGRANRPAGSARVLPAHLESNFINPEFRGAQPRECLRLPGASPPGDFPAAAILAEIGAARPDVGIVTLAPELDGALDLIGDLTRHGHVVSLGHSGATYDEAIAGIDAGARHATHLFNRMTPLGHRAPGLAGAALDRDDVLAEVICDGVHVHPAAVRIAFAAKSPSGILAVTDGTAGSGLPPGARALLGGQRIAVRETACLDDGTIAGSVLTMDRAFAVLAAAAGLGPVAAAAACSTTPARALHLRGLGVVAAGAAADLVVLDRHLRVARTYIAGELAWQRD